MKRLNAKSVVESGIRRGLETIGESPARSTLYYIQTKSGLTLEDIPDHPDDFCRALRSIFGLGSLVLIQSVRDKLRDTPVANEEERKYLEAFLSSVEEYLRPAETITI